MQLTGDAAMPRWIRENAGFIVFLLALGVFRTAVADWNPIPSGSMRPNLLEGDVVLVNRLAYDLKLPLTDRVLVRLDEPRRGDVVTFASPRDGTRLIKRIVGLPGDRVAMVDGALRFQGWSASYREPRWYREPAGGQALRLLEDLEPTAGTGPHPIQRLAGTAVPDDFGPVTVPPDHYLVLGDNRDNSADSRYFGFVPRSALIGRAHHILVSVDMLGDWLPRLGRFGLALP